MFGVFPHRLSVQSGLEGGLAGWLADGTPSDKFTAPDSCMVFGGATVATLGLAHYCRVDEAVVRERGLQVQAAAAARAARRLVRRHLGRGSSADAWRGYSGNSRVS